MDRVVISTRFLSFLVGILNNLSMFPQEVIYYILSNFFLQELNRHDVMPRGEQSSGKRISFWGQGWGKHLNTVGLVVTALDLQSQEGCETSEDTHFPSVWDGPTMVFVSWRNTGINPLGHLRDSCRTRARPAGTELAMLLAQRRHLSADAVLISSLKCFFWLLSCPQFPLSQKILGKKR